MRRRIFFSAGEPSGDRHAAGLLAAAKARADVEAFGFGGEHLAGAGAEILLPLADTAVMGLAGVARHLPTFARALRLFDDALLHRRPDCVVLVDYPTLHLRFAELARRRGVPAVAFVCPQLWAWAPWRARRFARAFDLALSILPFEERFLGGLGLRTRYVGHPVADTDRPRAPDEVDAFLAAEPDRPLVLLLPGSRRSEVEGNLPVQVEVARRLLSSATPAPRFVLVQERPERRADCEEAVRRIGASDAVLSPVLAPELAAARAALCVSGTVTLEVARLAVPMVVQYRAPALLLGLGRSLLTVPWISLVNLVAGEEICPEFVFARPPFDEIQAALRALLVDEQRRAAVSLALRERVVRRLGHGAYERAASLLLSEVPGGRRLSTEQAR